MRPSTKQGGSLAELQTKFSRKLLERGTRAPGGMVRSKNFRVYRNNVFASLIGSLSARYPVVERLVGEEFFEAAAGLFIESHPPRSPVIIEYGEAFAAFLENFEPARTLPYLGDVARLEWLRHKAYNAADRRALEPSDLASVAPDLAFNLKFRLHPATGLIASPFPVVSIWETNTCDDEVRPIGPGLPGEAALIVRPEYEVAVLRLEPGEHAFADALAQGETLAEAASRGTYAGGFDLAPALAKLISAGAFCGYSFPHPQVEIAHHA